MSSTSLFVDAETSDTEVEEKEVTFETASSKTIRFGKKWKGQTLGVLVKTKDGRSYLRYLLEWDALYDDMRLSIQCVLAAYDDAKKKS